MLKQIPSTNFEACLRYGSTAHKCSCPDSLNRKGGSYQDQFGRNICKHIAHVRLQELVRAAKAQELYISNRRLVPLANQTRFDFLEFEPLPVSYLGLTA